MKFELKGFQHTSALDIIAELEDARRSIERRAQAVVLSAPTGSGKTITIAAVIDWLFGGADGVVARPQTTFLWLSDSPELNQQSKDKLLSACDNIPFHRLVTVDSQSFNEERLAAGHVYFINTQLLGKDKLLTKPGGDTRFFTFFQTVANTIDRSPEDLVLIIDEAHRGAGVSDRSRKPIMQKFITGSPEDGLPPIPLVLGMSATPQRFHELLANTQRTHRPIDITPEQVRSSGLLKDLIVVTCPQVATHTDLTLLEEAASRWKEFTVRWERYSIKENEKQTVKPILVVQVADGSDTVLTRSPLDDIVKVIERKTGPLALGEIVHCFNDREEIEYGGRIIRRIDASRIQDTPMIRVVLFKTALSTGWDCPRAEVMMSFRRALDPTSIAQLVGRMIRTPLARRIESDEVLNTVELFLPHYDYENLDAVLTRLQNPDAEEGLATAATTKAQEYSRNPNFAEVFEHLATLPNYSVNRAPKMSDIKRALRLSALLMIEDIDKDADEALRERLVKRLKNFRDRYSKDAAWQKAVREEGEIDVDVMSVAVGSMNITGQRASRLKLSDENIHRLFENAGRVLASGEGLHRNYWKAHHDHSKPNLAKLEIAAMVGKTEVLAKLSQVAREEFQEMWDRHKSAIKNTSASVRTRFDHLIQTSGRAEKLDWELPDTIVTKPGELAFTDHLYVDSDGSFSVKLNTWERDFLDRARDEKGFVCWLRNIQRKDWALCIPYELAGEKPFFPDFVIIRSVNGAFVVDILEPHDSSRTDTWAKAKGLAKFADKHATDFGRLMIARMKEGTAQIIDVSQTAVRAKAATMMSANDLDALFDAVA